MVHAVIAESPISLVANVTPPVTEVSPGLAANAKGAALEALPRVISR